MFHMLLLLGLLFYSVVLGCGVCGGCALHCLHDRRAIHSFLARHMYHRRCKVDPLWNTVIVAGFDKGEGYVTWQVPGVGLDASAMTWAAYTGVWHVARVAAATRCDGRRLIELGRSSIVNIYRDHAPY